MATDQNYDETADKAAVGEPDVEGGMHVPTMDEIRGFRCDCCISWMPLWELCLDTMEYAFAIPCVFIPNCCAAGDDDEKCDGSLNRCCFCIPCIDLRLGVRIVSFLAMISAIGAFTTSLDWFNAGFWFWGVYGMGIAVTIFWLTYLEWMGASFADNDYLAISLNIQAWLIMLGVGSAIFQMITNPDQYSFGDFIMKALITNTLGYLFMANHVVKLYRKINEGGEDVDAWKEDASTLPWFGCPFCRSAPAQAGEVEVTDQPAEATQA